MQLAVVVGAVVLVGVLVAIPLVLMGRGEADRVEQGLQVADRANDAQAQVVLTNAIRAAEVFYAENGTFVGFTPDVAGQYDPSITYNAGASTSGQVSIRRITPTTAVVVTPSGSGATLCAAANLDVVTYGRQDATGATGCTGGW